MQSLRQKFTTKRITRHIKRIMPLLLIDTFIITIAYLFVLSIRVLSIPFDYTDSAPFILLALFITLTALYNLRAYHCIWSQTSGHSVLLLVGAFAVAFPVLFILNTLVKPQAIPYSVLIGANMLALMGVVAVRYRSRLITGVEWRVRALLFRQLPDTTSTRVLIIGAGESGEMLAWRLQHRLRSDEHYKVVGFIDDDPDKQGLYIEGLPVLGVRADIPHVTAEYAVDLVIVAIHNIEGANFRDILNYCEVTACRIKVVPDMLALLNGTTNATPIRDVEPEDLIGRSVITRHSSVDLSAVTGKRVLITGAAGSIGSELCRQMATYDPQCLIIVDVNESALFDLTIALQARHPELTIVEVLADVVSDEAMEAVFAAHQPQVVFHAAAYKHVPMLESYPMQALRVNVGGTFNVARLACYHRAERFVLISTDKAVNPSSVMGASKRLCEYIVHAYANMNDHDTYYTAVRFGNVFGSRGSVVPTFNRQIDSGGPVTVTDPEMTRYFMSISEAVNLVIHAACMTQGDEIFLLRMGETVRILDIAERMIRLRGLRPYEDISIEFVGVRPGEKIHEELHNEAEHPAETRHPSIFKLNGWEKNTDPAFFLRGVESLLAAGLPPECDPIETLLGVTMREYNHSGAD